MKRVILSLNLIGLFAVGCGGFYPPTVGPPPITGPDTPSIVAYNLELSFNNRDIQLYKACLSPNFAFHFHPSDVGKEVNGYVIPESWSYEEDWAATQNMFADAYDISFAIAADDIGDPEDGATEYTVEDIGISLLVMLDENNGFVVNPAVGAFRFETYDSSGDTYWRIIDWWDGDWGKAGKEASIGKIKAYFKEPKPD